MVARKFDSRRFSKFALSTWRPGASAQRSGEFRVSASPLRLNTQDQRYFTHRPVNRLRELICDSGRDEAQFTQLRPPRGGNSTLS